LNGEAKIASPFGDFVTKTAKLALEVLERRS